MRSVLFPETVARSANNVSHLEGGVAHRFMNLRECPTESGLETLRASIGLGKA